MTPATIMAAITNATVSIMTLRFIASPLSFVWLPCLRPASRKLRLRPTSSYPFPQRENRPPYLRGSRLHHWLPTPLGCPVLRSEVQSLYPAGSKFSIRASCPFATTGTLATQRIFVVALGLPAVTNFREPPKAEL